jgi:hypothetical protein
MPPTTELDDRPRRIHDDGPGGSGTSFAESGLIDWNDHTDLIVIPGSPPTAHPAAPPVRRYRRNGAS